MGISFISEIWLGIKCAFKKPVTLNKETILEQAKRTCNNLTIDPAKCIACKTCVRTCPNKCIKIIDKEHFEFNVSRCANCHLCQKLCPKNAITWTDIKNNFSNL